MAWEFAAIVRVNGGGNLGGMNEGTVKEKLAKWILVSPGKSPNPPRIKYNFMKKGWSSPVNKPYWAFTNDDEEKFKKEADQVKVSAMKNKTWTTSTEGRSRKIHYESSDLLSLINEAGKEGWEITGGIGFAGNQRGETRYRVMRREI